MMGARGKSVANRLSGFSLAVTQAIKACQSTATTGAMMRVLLLGGTGSIGAPILKGSLGAPEVLSEEGAIVEFGHWAAGYAGSIAERRKGAPPIRVETIPH
jgi:hypothetical protein